ncbi:MAG: cyanophycin synthetase [Bacillota bacterium]
MRIIEVRALRGPSFYSRYPAIFMKLDIGDLEWRPTDAVPNFRRNIEMVMPTLIEHRCSPGRRGGFFERVERGTWAGHVVEHVAIELQCLARTEVGYGKTMNTDSEGIYNIVYRYRDENVGLKAGEFAVKIVERLFEQKTTAIQPLILELNRIREASLYGPSTQSIVSEAEKRGIPHIRLNANSYVQLGHGMHQRRIQATIMDNTSALGVEIADDKERTKEMLSSMGIPVPKGQSVLNLDEALQEASIIGYPLVVKPLTGNYGRGITTNINNSEELEAAFRIAKGVCDTVLVERHLKGFDYRILVIDGKFVAAALREPARVTGNGKNTIQELIDEINIDPDRGVAHEKLLTRIEIDHMTERLLSLRELSLQSILPEGEKVVIKSAANLSAGGSAVDVTDDVHPLIRLMSERISRIIGLNVIGIDIIAPSLQEPLCEELAGVLEVNAAPGFRMHLSPFKGAPRNVAAHIVDMLFPPGSAHRVPIIAVTGTNGKTTTVRLISHILGINGSTVGMTSSDSVVIHNVPIIEGDYSGPEGAKRVLMDPTIDHAVLEVARGGIIRRGLGFAESDVGVFLNVTPDHLGEGDIDTKEDLARLKTTVIETVKPTGYAVLNAEDPLVLSSMNRTRGKIILFSLNPENPVLKKNLVNGNMNVILKDDAITIQNKGWASTVANVVEIPITFDGQAMFNVENVLAAVAATSALGLTDKQIRAGLVSFSPSIGQSPGRMNVIEMDYFRAIVDYGHNVGAINATGNFIQGLVPGRKIRMAAGTGNRRDEDIIELGLALANYSDHVIVTDSDPRGRKPGVTAQLVRQGLLKGGFTHDMITMVLDEREATKTALDMAGQGDLVVLQATDICQVIRDVLDYKEGILHRGSEMDIDAIPVLERPAGPSYPST